MREKRRGMLTRLGLAAALAFGLMPTAAFANAEIGGEATPPRARFPR